MKETSGEPQEIESFSATGIDNALDLLEVVNAKTDKASVGQQAAGIERHPEVSVDVGVRTQLTETRPCLPAPAAKIQGKNLFDYSNDMPCCGHVLTVLGLPIRPPWRLTRNGSYPNSGMRYFSDSVPYRWLCLEMSDCHRCSAPGFAFAAVRGTSVQEIPEGSGESVSEFSHQRGLALVRSFQH